MTDYDAATKYVSLPTMVDLIAEAWSVLSWERDGKTVDPDLPFYINDEWAKMARRVLRGFAESNVRPDVYPWTDKRFDRFKWMSDATPGVAE